MDLIAGLKSKLGFAPEDDADIPEDDLGQGGFGEYFDGEDSGQASEEEAFAPVRRRASEDFRRPPEGARRGGSGLVSREDVKRYIRRPDYGQAPSGSFRAPQMSAQMPPQMPPQPPQRTDSRPFAQDFQASLQDARGFAPQPMPEPRLPWLSSSPRPASQDEDPWKAPARTLESAAREAPAEPPAWEPAPEPPAAAAPEASEAPTRRSYAQTAFMGPRADESREPASPYAYAYPTQSSAPRPTANPYAGTAGYAGAPSYPEFAQQPGAAPSGEIVGGFLPNGPATPPVRDITVVDPQTFEDAEPIAEALRARSCVAITLRKVPEFLSRRIMDFAFGAASVSGATVGVIANKVYALTFDRPLNEYEILSLRNKGAL